MIDQFHTKISVVMAIYNGEEYLHEQITSIKVQSLAPDEIIFIDDCSTNDPSEIIQNALKGSSIKFSILKNKKNEGMNFSFRRGVKEASGDIIFFSDHDDIWFESKIKKIVDFFKANSSASVVINDCSFLRNGKVSSGLTKAKTILAHSGTLDHFVAGCCTAFDGLVLNAVDKGLYENLNYDDQVHMIGRLLKRRFFFNESLQLYRRHLNNISKIPQNDEIEVSLLSKYNSKVRHEFIKFFFIDMLIMDIDELKIHLERLQLLYPSVGDEFFKHSQLVKIAISLKEDSNNFLLINSNKFNGVFFRIIFGYYFIKFIKLFRNKI